MSNGYFRFKKFTVWHDRCGMKVGTDGVLLGAWANGGRRILDIGTGSGVIALFMAQRYRNAVITAIDIDSAACSQAEDNVRMSVFNGRINVVESSLQHFEYGKYDAIVCNPPFYADSLKSDDRRRTLARHTDTLSFHDLFSCAAKLLADDGEFSVVIPAAVRSTFDMEAAFSNLFTSRVCALRTVPHKPVSRLLLAYRKHPVYKVEEALEYLNNADMTRSAWYDSLTQDFYEKQEENEKR